MRTLLISVLALTASACSMSGDDGDLSFRVLASTQSGTEVGAATVLRTEAEAGAFLAALNTTAQIDADFATETVLAISTFGPCPATNYGLTVTDVAADGQGGAVVSARVGQTGDVGGGALTYPVQIIAVERLSTTVVGGLTEARVATRLSGDQADCRR